MGTAHEGTADGTEVNCTFAHVQGNSICSLTYNTIFVLDIAAGTVKLVSGLSATVSFLRTLGSLYDSFGISAQTVNAVQLSLQDAVNNVSHVNEYIVAEVVVVSVVIKYHLEAGGVFNAC